MEANKQRILVVDDEPQILRVLRRMLMTHGYDVQVANNGEEAWNLVGDWVPNLVITDLMMPKINGVELCRKLRTISDIPIIILSIKGDEQQKVEALDSGADDYVTKPFGAEELLARVRAALRRSQAIDINQSFSILEIGDFVIDQQAHRVTVQGQAIHLTPKEFELLAFFMRNVGKVLTHRTLLTNVWGSNYVEQTEYLRVFVGQLRKKIEPNPTNPSYLNTEPWIGYRFNPHRSKISS